MPLRSPPDCRINEGLSHTLFEALSLPSIPGSLPPLSSIFSAEEEDSCAIDASADIVNMCASSRECFSSKASCLRRLSSSFSDMARENSRRACMVNNISSRYSILSISHNYPLNFGALRHHLKTIRRQGVEMMLCSLSRCAKQK